MSTDVTSARNYQEVINETMMVFLVSVVFNLRNKSQDTLHTFQMPPAHSGGPCARLEFSLLQMVSLWVVSTALDPGFNSGAKKLFHFDPQLSTPGNFVTDKAIIFLTWLSYFYLYLGSQGSGGENEEEAIW